MTFVPSDLDAYFEPLSLALNAFASERGLLVERYYHESPSWSLCFGHPRGGQAKLDVSAKSEEEVVIQAVWWLDSYTNFTRSLRWGEKQNCARESHVVEAVVSRIFSEALNWQLGTWTQVAEGYKPYWSSFTPEAFAAFANPWPKPAHRDDA